MSYWEDLQIALATVARLETELATAKQHLASLQNLAVKGGPDVSQFNGDVTWATVKNAGYEFAFARVADGNIRDSLFNTARVNAMRSAGLIMGTYYFGRVASSSNSERNGKSEAAMAIYFAESQGALKSGDLPLVYDFENDSINNQTPEKSALHLMEWVNAYKYIKEHWPIVYINPSTYNFISASLTTEQKGKLALCPLWIANPDVATPTVPDAWASVGWKFWQYSFNETVPGIADPTVDMNRFSGSRTELQGMLIK